MEEREMRLVLRASDFGGFDEDGRPLKTPARLSDMVKRLRTNAHMAQEELGRRCGARQARISSLEHGRAYLSIEMLTRIAEATGMRVEIVIRDPMNTGR